MDPLDFGKTCNAVNDKFIGNPYFDILNFLELNEDGFQEDVVPPEYVPERSPTSDNPIVSTTSKNCNIIHENRVKKKKMKIEGRIAFITKSEVETILDDGFKWRKYGKKMVKNSPNPRNYFKCSNGGCGVKKRVERDNEDSRYVRTTYDGMHNHESPCVLYDNHHNNIKPHAWTLQPSDSSTTS